MDGCSPYSRMILGNRGATSPTVADADDSAAPATAKTRTAWAGGSDSKRISQHRRIEQLLPHPTGDRFLLFKLVAADLLALLAACGLLSLLLPKWGLPTVDLPIFAVLVTLFGFSEGLYRSDADPYPTGMFPLLFRSTLFAVSLVLVSVKGIRPFAVFTIFGCSLAALVLLRRSKQIVWKRRRSETELRRVLIVGGGPVAQSIAQTLRNDPMRRASVCGFVDNDLPLSPMVLGRISDLDWLARAQFIDEIILAVPTQPPQAREAAEIAYRNHLDIRAVPGLPAGPWFDQSVDRIGDVPVVTLHREPIPGPALLLKRLLDIAGATIALVLASPVMAAVALLIRLDSAGPVVYSAERTGARGCRFRCYKFRSMVTDAERLKDELRSRNQRQGPIFKIDDDPRVTRVGKIIRRYSLDELPQLWNVLRGDMSLVGPRPHPVDEVNHYDLQHYRRLDVKPGITCLWQITARDCPSFDLNMHLDLTYIENWSLGLDLRILASTVRVLFAPEGA
jgi:exopolysaccharide biosynthesis polyprenyl glycosylphosphotransferase